MPRKIGSAFFSRNDFFPREKNPLTINVIWCDRQRIRR